MLAQETDLYIEPFAEVCFPDPADVPFILKFERMNKEIVPSKVIKVGIAHYLFI